jgi:hypothetical protein
MRFGWHLLATKSTNYGHRSHWTKVMAARASAKADCILALGASN